ncbi:MAG: DUF2628 domain-containing protein [Oscillospiraceae bacterium]|nr:DUF2628 domain-containing protein [Oscillospiraceae bacterium]
MDFIGYSCPVCDKNFHADDDIVVCPVCGTPHHRDCYEKNGECINADKHSQGYNFETDADEKSAPDGAIKCKQCGHLNPEGCFFCSQCRAPLENRQNANTYQGGSPFGGAPFGGTPFGGGNPNGGNPFGGNMGGFNTVQFDPMAGVSPDAEFDEGAKAGEVAKYVKQNTTYFMQVFNKIKNFGKSKFSFAGLFFGGGYLLYRKQYVIGTIITVIMAACLIFSTYGNFTVLNNILNDIYSDTSIKLTSYTQLFSLVGEKINLLDMQSYVIVMATFVCEIIFYGLYLFCGFNANRLYYKHCCKQVNKIKTNATSDTESDNQLQTKGGVNTALGFSLLAVLLLINFVPQFIF